VTERRPDHIITRPEILGILKRIFENRSLLSIKLEQHPQPCNSTILGIDSRKGLLLIDDLFPAPPVDPERNTPLHIFTRLNGICVNFSCVLKAAGQSQNHRQYQLALPNRVHYHQRRRHYRIPLGWTAAGLHWQAGKNATNAILTDISASGIGARIENSLGMDLESEHVLEPCTLTIPGFMQMDLALRVRSVRSNLPERNVYFGAEFIRLDHHQQKLLQQLMPHLDREACQIRTQAPQPGQRGSLG